MMAGRSICWSTTTEPKQDEECPMSLRAGTFLYMLGNQKIDFSAKASPEMIKKEAELDDEIIAARALIEKVKKGEL